MTASESLAHAAKRVFLAFRARSLADVAGEQKTKRQAFEAIQRRYNSQLAEFLRIPGTTYGDWLKHGPFPDYDEVVAAAEVDAVWDRLVERCIAPEMDIHG